MTDAAEPAPNNGLTYSEQAIGRTHHALVVTPSAKLSWGRDMLEGLRAHISNSVRDVELVDAFKEAPSKPRVFIFRGSNQDHSAHIRFDPSLDEHEREELGYLLFQSHMPILRSLLASGAQLYVYVDWDSDMLGLFRRAMGRIADERSARIDEASDPSTTRLMQLDRWMLTLQTLFFAQPFDDVMRHLLPDSLPLFDRREERVARLLEGIPPECFELHPEGA